MVRILSSAAVLVAVVTGFWAVTVAAHTLVRVVRLGLLVGRGGMAVDAGEARIVGRNLVTIGTYGAVVRNREIGVIESRSQPTRGGVAAIAGRWITSRNMVRHRAAQSLCAVPIGDVASVANWVPQG